MACIGSRFNYKNQQTFFDAMARRAQELKRALGLV